MPYSFNYHDDEDYIEAVFTGSVNLGTVRTYLAKLLPVLEQTGCRRTFTDARKAQSHATAHDILQFPKMLSASPLTQRLKRAILISPGASGFDMVESVSIAQNQNVKLYTDRGEALEWLLSEEE